MRIRILTSAIVGLGLAACVAPEQRSVPDTSVITSGPLAVQSAVRWPPRAVANQPEGAMPDFGAKNQNCLLCHPDVLDAKSARTDVVNLHKRHLESKKTAYGGANRDCLTCHEGFTVSKNAAPKEGSFVMNDVYHPNTARVSEIGSSKLIVHTAAPKYGMVDALHPANPYPYKRTLERLVCLDCHGADSKIKTFYGAPGPAQ